MAIKRCPYCRALIDEKDQYCNNCGTQLLFPEDGEIEEEIPGDKIIDADVEEKDYEIPEPGAERGYAEEEEADDDDDEEPEEVILVDEIEAIENSPDPEGKDSGEDDAEEPVKEPEEKTPPVSPVEPSSVIEPEPPAATGSEGPGEEKMGEAPEASPDAGEPDHPAGLRDETGEIGEEPPAEPKAMTFDTRDLDKIGRTADLGKEQIEKFLDALKEGAENMDILTRPRREPDEGLPPWATMMKETPPPAETPAAEETGMTVEEEAGDREPDEMEERDEEQDRAEEDLEEIADVRPSPRLPDSGIGLPEKVTQAALPFEKPIPREAPAAEEPPAPARREWPLRSERGEREEIEEEREEEEAEQETPKEHPPFSLSVFLKAKAFDVLFVAVFWLVSLWLAAKSMSVTLFQILGAAATGLFVFLGILLGLYFFLFYFFLGETLGDRLFRDED